MARRKTRDIWQEYGSDGLRRLVAVVIPALRQRGPCDRVTLARHTDMSPEELRRDLVALLMMGGLYQDGDQYALSEGWRTQDGQDRGLYRWLRGEPLTVGRPEIDPMLRADAVRIAQKGKISRKELAEFLDISQSTLSRILRDAGIRGKRGRPPKPKATTEA